MKSPTASSSTPENTIANFGPIYLTNKYSGDKSPFIALHIWFITLSPVFLLYVSFISTKFIILYRHTVDVVYWSIVFFPSAYKNSAVFSSEYLSSFTILSIIDWFSTVFNTDTMLFLTTSKTVVSTLSYSCGKFPSIIQYPIYTLSIYKGKNIADFALANSIFWYGSFSPSLFTVIYFEIPVSILSLNIGSNCNVFRADQCFSATFVAFITYSAPL